MANSDVYHRQARKPNFEDYYELLLVYVDDVLCCLHNSKLIMDTLALSCDLKDRSVGPPKIDSGSEFKIYRVRSGESHLIMSSTRYVKNVNKTVEILLKDGERQLRKSKSAGKLPLSNGYRPELDQSN